MGVFSFERGAVVQIDGADHRFSLKITDTCWQLEQLKNGRVREFEQEDLRRMYVEQRLTVSGGVPVRRPDIADPETAEEAHEVAKMRRMYVLEVLNVPNSQKQMGPLIKSLWDRIKIPASPPSVTSVWRWKSRYIAAGSDYRILADNNAAKGNRLGHFSAEVKALCQQSIESKYLTRERPNIQATLKDAVSRVKKANRVLPKDVELELPTRRLIRRLIGDIPEFDKYVARYGRDEARKKFRSVKGHVVTQKPLERAEIDHTELDLIVVDDKNPQLIYGRPWVTACIDDFTRCILGVYVGFTPPSYQSVAACLKDCFLPKVNLRRDNPDIENDWPSYGVMRELVLDNGREFHSESLEQVCYSLGIDMHYAPRKVAWFKGKIERFFRTLNEGVAHGKPGTTFSNIPERGDYDSQKHAVVRFSTLKKMLRLWIADIYHQEIHSSLQKTPTQMWTANISPEDIEIPKSLNDLEVVMGRVFARTLDHSGIEFEGLHYNSPELRELRRREGAKLKVQIRVNESNIGTIFVLSPRTSEPYSVTASEFEYADGLSLWQHEVISKWNRQNADADEGEPDRLRAREKMDRMVHDDSALKRNRSSKRVARYREASEEASVKTAGSKMKLFQPDALANASGSNRTARSGDHPATHVCDLMHLVEEDLDAGVPDFIPEYKKRYECE